MDFTIIISPVGSLRGGESFARGGLSHFSDSSPLAMSGERGAGAMAIALASTINRWWRGRRRGCRREQGDAGEAVGGRGRATGGTAARSGPIVQIWKIGPRAAADDMAEEGHRPPAIKRRRRGGHSAGMVYGEGDRGRSAGRTEDVAGRFSRSGKSAVPRGHISVRGKGCALRLSV